MDSMEIMNGLRLSDSDFVGDVEDLDGNVYIAHDHGFVVGACLSTGGVQDALDILADEGCLDRYEVSDDELKKDYPDYESGNCDAISHLGNYCKPYDIETLDIVEMPAPKFSIIALLKGGGWKVGLGK